MTSKIKAQGRWLLCTMSAKHLGGWLKDLNVDLCTSEAGGHLHFSQRATHVWAMLLEQAGAPGDSMRVWYLSWGDTAAMTWHSWKLPYNPASLEYFRFVCFFYKIHLILLIKNKVLWWIQGNKIFPKQAVSVRTGSKPWNFNPWLISLSNLR